MSKDEKLTIILGAIAIGVFLIYRSEMEQKTTYRNPSRVSRFSGGAGVDPYDQSPYTVRNFFDSSGLSTVASVAGLAVLA